MSVSLAPSSPVRILDSPLITSHKRKRDSDESGSEQPSSEEEEEDLDETHESNQESSVYNSRKSIRQLEDLLEEMQTLPESSKRNADIKNLEEFTKALDSYDFESCLRYQKCIDQTDLENIIETAEGELFVEGMIRNGLKRAKSKPPKNEHVARALSHFTGPSGEEEVKELIAKVTNTMSGLGEVNDPDILRRCAEPLIVDLIFDWGSKEEEVRAGLVKLFKFEPALW